MQHSFFTVFTGPSGRKPGKAKPFERLSNSQIQVELRNREKYDFGNTKAELIESL